MLETIVKQQIILFVMGLLMLLGVFAKLVSHFTVKRMARAAGEIQKSNHKLMKLVKAKFEHASMISDKVQNVEAFVDKYIYEYKVFGVRLSSWRSFQKKLVWLIGALGIFAIFESYRMGETGDLLLQYAQWTIVFSLILVMLSFVAEETTRLDATKNYMVEYLENVCIHRYAKLNHAAETEPPEKMPEEVAEERSEEAQEALTEVVQDEQKKDEQEMRIRAILEEFLA